MSSLLITELSRLMREYPVFAAYLKTARDAVLHSSGAQGPNGRIIAALRMGGATYEDLIQTTKLTRTTLHRHLKRMAKAGIVEARQEPYRGEGGPRKIFFLKRKTKSFE